MLPENRLSSKPVPSPFSGATATALLSRVDDYEDGPVALQDPSQGLQFQRWRARAVAGQVLLSAPNYPETVLIDGSFVADISIAFDNNANLYYVWTAEGITRLRWFNTAISAYDVMQLPTGIRTPKLTLDDKRPTQSGANDVLLFYIGKDNKLYHRRQRDRFAIEILLSDGPYISIERAGMNTGLRVQWLLTRGDPNANI